MNPATMLSTHQATTTVMDHEPTMEEKPTMDEKNAVTSLEKNAVSGDSGSQSSLSEVEKRDLRHTDTMQTSFESSGEAGLLYKNGGELVLLPAPTKDPRDPLNMSVGRKILALSCLCLFGAFAASAELILGSMLPVFALEYAGVNPKYLLQFTELHLFPTGQDSIAFLSELPGAPPIWHTYMLGSMPLLIMGLTNLLFVPLAIAVGRRPVVLCTGVLAIVGALWAGFSHSLGSHIGARCLQALGAGTVESLIPFIIQDVVFFHQRNTWISVIFACQGTIIIALGISAPYMITYLSWRWVYYITAAGAGVFLIGVFFFMPETRWYRSKDELKGIPRPAHLETSSEPRTFAYSLKFQVGPIEFRKGAIAVWDTLTTFFYPHIFFITMLNSGMIASAFAASFIISPELLSPPYNWNFLNLGLCLVPVIIAAAATALVSGSLADKLANWFAKKRGRRLPENQLINLVLPVTCSIVGSIVFGYAGEHPGQLGWPVFLMALGFMAFGFLGAGTVGAVYVLESYPQLAGPALVNIASFRCILAFALSFYVSEWVVTLGYLKSMLIYTGIIGGFAIMLPLSYVWGPAWRRRWPGPDR